MLILDSNELHVNITDILNQLYDSENIVNFTISPQTIVLLILITLFNEKRNANIISSG